MTDFFTLIDAVVDMEWRMFVSVNGETISGACQENPQTFAAMRKSQFSNWSEAAVRSYHRDLLNAERKDCNLLREKFLYMMEGTDPRQFAKLREELPETGEKKKELVCALSERMLRQLAALYREYPYLSSTSRPLYAVDNTPEITSAETYQKCELLTYSEETLEALQAHLDELESRGESLAEKILRDSMRYYGYQNLQDAEEKAAAYWKEQDKTQDKTEKN